MRTRFWLWLIASCPAANAAISHFERAQRNSRPCPRACEDSRDPGDWSHYHAVERLAVCDEPMLLDFSLYNPINDDSTDVTIRACTLGDASSEANYLFDSGYVGPDATGKTNFGPNKLKARDSDAGAACVATAAEERSLTAKLTLWELTEDFLGNRTSDVLLVAESLESSLLTGSDMCDTRIVFSYFHGTVVALYAGMQVDMTRTAKSLLRELVRELQRSDGTQQKKAVEVCSGQSCTAGTLFGVMADASGDLGAVQAVVKNWNEGKLVAEAEGDAGATSSIDDVKAWISPRGSNGTLAGNETAPAVGFRAQQMAECRFIRVQKDDTCTSLAQRCGIGSTAFLSFNSGIQYFCARLEEDQPVCCSSGTLPGDEPNPDGSCKSYDVKMGDGGCSAIAATHGITQTQLKEYNRKTWGWSGCGNVQAGIRICVSAGQPPMPAEVWDAQCGPTVPGTEPPDEGLQLGDMNPCPLDVCCNVWGKCGVDKDFCIISRTETGNPGTSKPGENGCVSNCGMEIVNNDKGPNEYRKIGYFEGWNYDRPCLHMDVLDIDNSFTHIHFAFAHFDTDLAPIVPEESREQFDKFASADVSFGPRKILSFGGWAFSNEGDTADLFRQAVAPANRERVADLCVELANRRGLDGLDFDWEYPGATDIPGSVPGEEEDGENYYQFLKLVREKLPAEKTVSIAAASSYWYLRGFPIKKMAEVLDYIIFMTYDLHGKTSPFPFPFSALSSKAVKLSPPLSSQVSGM